MHFWTFSCSFFLCTFDWRKTLNMCSGVRWPSFILFFIFNQCESLCCEALSFLAFPGANLVTEVKRRGSTFSVADKGVDLKVRRRDILLHVTVMSLSGTTINVAALCSRFKGLLSSYCNTQFALLCCEFQQIYFKAVGSVQIIAFISPSPMHSDQMLQLSQPLFNDSQIREAAVIASTERL